MTNYQYPEDQDQEYVDEDQKYEFEENYEVGQGKED